MVISCPACGTRYVVPDSAIGFEGRTVRCANCRHSWFQDGSVAALAATDPSPPTQKNAAKPAATGPAAPPRPQAEKRPRADPKPQTKTAAAPSVSPAASPAPRPATPDAAGPDEAATAPTQRRPEPDLPPSPPPVEPGPRRDVLRDSEPGHSQFDHSPPFRPRRNWLKLLTWAGAIFALLAIGTIAAVSYWGLPDWVPIERPTFGQAQPDLVLEFPPERQDRRTLPDGTEFFGISGSVTNVGERTRRVPPILIVLRDERERLIYRYEIKPPQPSLAPGESMSINEAALDVPPAARAAEIGWKPT